MCTRFLAIGWILVMLVLGGVAARMAPVKTGSELANCLGRDQMDVASPRSLNTLQCARIEHLETRETTTDAEVKRVKTRYGPFTVPSVTVDGGMKSYLQTEGVAKPCSNCTIIVAKPGLEFTDGSYANANTSMWLHHIEIFNSARRDTTCPQIPERMMASGNERTTHVYTVPGQRKAGVYLGDEPIWILAELMNMVQESRDAVITWEWDYVEGHPAEYARLTPLWLDVTGVCGLADVKVPPGEDVFTYRQNPTWKSTISGDIITTGGHIHDGGVQVRITKNGEVLCDSVARYGESSGFIDSMGDSDRGMPMDGHPNHGAHGETMGHLSSMKVCNWANLGSTKVGDEWTVEATYNLTQHAPMMHHGEPSDVMGSAMVYIAEY